MWIPRSGFSVRSIAMILIEVSSSAYHSGMLTLGTQQPKEEETSRRFYTEQHKCYWGIALPARTMDVCILN
jgi:hypothetical protein